MGRIGRTYKELNLVRQPSATFGVRLSFEYLSQSHRRKIESALTLVASRSVPDRANGAELKSYAALSRERLKTSGELPRSGTEH